MKTKLSSYLAAFFLFLIIYLIFKDILENSFANFSWSFFTESPTHAGRQGGILPILYSTFLILLICLTTVIPLGLGTALYLYYSNSKSTVWLQNSIEILSGVPSIVFGLFGNALFCIYFSLGFSILSGGLTLALMSLPLFVNTVSKGLEATPSNFLKVSQSLGLSKFTTSINVLIPFALPSIVVGIILSVGRSLAETAALIFTSGYVDRMPESLLDSGRALSLHIYDLAMNVPGGNQNAYKSAAVLILLIFSVNALINLILKHWYKSRIPL